jgi:hypothetical protein
VSHGATVTAAADVSEHTPPRFPILPHSAFLSDRSLQQMGYKGSCSGLPRDRGWAHCPMGVWAYCPQGDDLPGLGEPPSGWAAIRVGRRQGRQAAFRGS